AVLVSATAVSGELTLWGVDENDGELFSIDSYSTLLRFTSYGKLKYYKGTKLKNVGARIEAFGLDPDGMVYMAVNHDLAGIREPVFMKFNIADATTTGPNVVTVVGRIGVAFDSSRHNITGLSYHPGTGELYALFRDNHDSTTDRLLIIDKDTGAVVSGLGTITGLGEKVQSGEDLSFDDRGNLYVTDNKDDHLCRGPQTGRRGRRSRTGRKTPRTHRTVYRAQALPPHHKTGIAASDRAAVVPGGISPVVQSVL
ncbi:unnamed protein product, partial [marine sediment metagenome]